MRNYNYFGSVAKILLFSVFLIASYSDPASASANNIGGTWDSNWGKMVFTQSGTNITGTYATSNGKIYGILTGNVLEGYWTQSSAGRRCSTMKQGSYYWGRVRFVFDQNGHFSGTWGYCENTPSQGGWTGTKLRAAAQNGGNQEMPSYSSITGAWNSNWGKMSFQQSGNSVSGSYATSNGKIYGILTGNILEGYWTQSSAGQRCSTMMHGTYYWGRIRFVFDPNGHFDGTWGYCENTPSAGGWTGTKQ